MIRNLLAACCGPLLLAACARGVATAPPTLPGYALRTASVVEAIQDYEVPRNVPAPFQHLVDWHAGTGPVVLLLAQRGHRACAITPVEAARVTINRRYSCRWSAAR